MGLIRWCLRSVIHSMLSPLQNGLYYRKSFPSHSLSGVKRDNPERKCPSVANPLVKCFLHPWEFMSPVNDWVLLDKSFKVYLKPGSHVSISMRTKQKSCEIRIVVIISIHPSISQEPNKSETKKNSCCFTLASLRGDSMLCFRIDLVIMLMSLVWIRL